MRIVRVFALGAVVCLSLSAMAFLGVPLMAVWFGISLWLGRANARRAAAS